MVVVVVVIAGGPRDPVSSEKFICDPPDRPGFSVDVGEQFGEIHVGEIFLTSPSS